MQDLNVLFKRYLNRECTPEEVRILMRHFLPEKNDRSLRELIEAELQKEAPEGEEAAEVSGILEKNHRKIMQKVRQAPAAGVKPLRRLHIWYAAASVVIALGIGLYLFYPGTPEPEPELEIASQPMNDANPGGNRATLTLADGRAIGLDDAAIGELAQQAGMLIRKTEDGQVAYESAGEVSQAASEAYNILTTPYGGQYRIILPDGSKVWLNAASTLRYPAKFDGKERMVELNGEAYFEVARNDKQPFVVKNAVQVVRVLGTHFNVKAYGNEPAVMTTLVEGRVSVSQVSTGKERLLHPGEQAQLTGDSFHVTPVDIEASIAWKNGQFLFRNTDIRTIMKQLERWYQVEVDMSNLPDKRFYGEMSRDVKLSQVLHMMEVTSDLQFKIEGKKIILKK